MEINLFGGNVVDNLILKNGFFEECQNNPLVYKVEYNDNYLKIFTEIFIKREDSYLNLYLIFEDEGVCLSDSNEIYRIYDGYYDISNEMLKGFAESLDLDYENYRFTKYVTLDTLGFELQKFEKLKEMIENLE